MLQSSSPKYLLPCPGSQSLGEDTAAALGLQLAVTALVMTQWFLPLGRR
jgi:hypothetical protein